MNNEQYLALLLATKHLINKVDFGKVYKNSHELIMVNDELSDMLEGFYENGIELEQYINQEIRRINDEMVKGE